MQIKSISNIHRLALVSLDWIRPKDPKIPLGQASLLAKIYENKILNKKLTVKNFEFDVKDSFKNGDENYFNNFCHEISHKIYSTSPDLIALGAFVWNEQHIQKILSILRNDLKYDRKILVGGPQVSYALPGTLEALYPHADYFIRGYAENSFNQLLVSLVNQNLNEIKISGVHVRGSIDLGLQSTLSTKLEDLPSPFLTKIIDLNRNFIRWESQRGCPFRCSFCQHRDNYSNRQTICSDRIEQEIKLICDRTISMVDDIAVLDPTFNAGSKYLDILDLFIRYKYKGKIALQTRMEMINSEFMQKIEKLNDQGARVILECGIQTVINDEMKIIKRLNNLKKIEKISGELRCRGIEFQVSLIFGLPKQTLDSFRKSIDFCINRIGANKIEAWPLMLLRGTELEQKKSLFNLKEEIINFDFNLPNERLFIGIPHVTSSNTFNRNDWTQMLKLSKQLI